MELQERAELAQKYAEMDKEALIAEAVSAIGNANSWRARAESQGARIAETEMVLRMLVKNGYIERDPAGEIASALGLSITRRVEVEMTITIAGYVEIELCDELPEDKWDWELDRLEVTTDGQELEITQQNITHIDATEIDE